MYTTGKCIHDKPGTTRKKDNERDLPIKPQVQTQQKNHEVQVASTSMAPMRISGLTITQGCLVTIHEPVSLNKELSTSSLNYHHTNRSTGASMTTHNTLCLLACQAPRKKEVSNHKTILKRFQIQTQHAKNLCGCEPIAPKG